MKYGRRYHAIQHRKVLVCSFTMEWMLCGTSMLSGTRVLASYLKLLFVSLWTENCSEQNQNNQRSREAWERHYDCTVNISLTNMWQALNKRNGLSWKHITNNTLLLGRPQLCLSSAYTPWWLFGNLGLWPACQVTALLESLTPLSKWLQLQLWKRTLYLYA